MNEVIDSYLDFLKDWLHKNETRGYRGFEKEQKILKIILC